MSAFMCENDHISHLAFAAVRRDRHGSIALGGKAVAGLGGSLMPGEYWDHLSDADRARYVFRVLAAANVESLQARYGERSEDMLGDVVFVPSVGAKPPPAAVQVIKSVHCYEYQACEFDGYENSLARQICKDIVAASIRRLPGYDDAPWGAPVGPGGVLLTSLARKR
jgi:hypothetical protein